MKFSRYSLALLFPLIFLIQCTKNNAPNSPNSNDWQRTSTPPKGFDSIRLKPSTVSGVTLKKIVSNDDLLKSNDGRVFEMGNSLLVSDSGDVFFWIEMKRRAPNWAPTQEERAAKPDHSLPKDSPRIYRLFRWNKESGLKIIASEVPLQLPQTLFFSEHTIGSCLKDSVVVAGIQKIKMVDDCSLGKCTNRTVGPTIGAAICYPIAAQGEVNGEVLFETPNSVSAFFGGAVPLVGTHQDPQVLFSEIKSTNPIYDRTFSKKTSQELGRTVTLSTINLKSKTITPLKTPKNSIFDLISNLSWYQSTWLFGLTPKAQLKFCKPDTSFKNFQCTESWAPPPDTTAVLTSDQSLYFGTTTGLTQEMKLASPGKVIKAHAPKLGLTSIEMPGPFLEIATGFYSIKALTVSKSGETLTIAESLPFADFGNAIYQLIETKPAK